MSDHIQHLITRGEDAQRYFRERASNLDDRMAAWALVGNGAALLLCFNGVLDNKICSWSAISTLVWLFFLGLTCAFAKIVFAQRVHNDAEKTMILMNSAARMAASLIEAKRAASEAGVVNDLSKQYDEAIARLEQLQRPTKLIKVLEPASSWLLGASVLCFGGSIFWALRSNLIFSALCPPA